MHTLIRKMVMPFIRCFGSRIRDELTGEELGRAWIAVWGGRVYLIGFTGETPVVPVYVSEDRVRYWRRRLGFRAAVEPDFSRARPPGGPPSPASVDS